MVKIGREELKKDWPLFIKAIQQIHQTPPYIEREIAEVPEEMFVRRSKHFLILVGMHCQYTMGHRFRGNFKDGTIAIGRSLEELIIYDSFIEYEADRQRTLNAPGTDKEVPNQN